MRLASDLKQLEKRKVKHFTLATEALKQLESQPFACQPDATAAASAFLQQLPYHQLHDLQVSEIVEYARRGRLRKDAGGQKHYQISATLVPKATVICRTATRWIVPFG
jgi:transposase